MMKGGWVQGQSGGGRENSDAENEFWERGGWYL